MDVETVIDLRENEIPDDMILEIDDSCNASTEANDGNEIDNAATQLPKDSNADRECEGALDENDSADCVSEHVQPSGTQKLQLFRIIVISMTIRFDHW